MKFKKSIILLVIAIFIFGVASVCASDVNDTIVASEDTGQMELSASNQIAEDNLQISEENNTLIQANYKSIFDFEIDYYNGTSFEGLQNKIDQLQLNGGGILYLNKDITATTRSSEITISEPIIICGNHRTIDARSFTRIFHITSSLPVIMYNITFKNGNTLDGGGAILSELANVTIVNCTFINNKAIYGGAIYSAGVLNIEGSQFINNEAYESGGAIYDLRTILSVSGSSFINNTAAENGGAIISTALIGDPITYRIVKIMQSVFITNRAPGGAQVYVSKQRCQIAFSILITDYSNTLNFESFDSDVSNDYNWWGSTAADYDIGPARHANSWYFLNMTASDNLATISFNIYRSTGVIYDDGFCMLPPVNLTLTAVNATFSEKSVLMRNADQLLDAGNADQLPDGDVLSPVGSISSNVTVNYQLNGYPSYLTATYIPIQFQYLNSSITVQPEVLGDFGQLQKLINNASDNDIINLERNYTYTIGIDTITTGIVINKTNLTINGNGFTIDALEKSRIFNITQGANVVLNNITFKNGFVGEDNGGAILNMGKITIVNATFINNKADVGGAIWNMGNIIIVNATFINNKADVGGAIYSFSLQGTSEVRNCIFTKNSAISRGGAIHFIGNDDVADCNFVGNNASSGSAIYFGSFPLFSQSNSISNSYFFNNQANVGSNTPLDVVQNGNSIEITFQGRNNLINAIYSAGDVRFTNVTYWGSNGIANTGSSTTVLTRSQNEAGQNVSVIMLVNDIALINTTKVTDDDGKIVLDMVAGLSTITARHYTDSYYTEAVKTETFNNAGTETSLALSTFEHTATARITPGDATGIIILSVENESGVVRTVERILNEGAVELDLSGLAVGKYNISATYGGNINYYPSKSTIYYEKVQLDSTILIEAANITTDKNEIINITVNKFKDKNVTVKVNKDEYKVNDGTLTLTNLDEGIYNVTVFWSGDVDYKNSSNSTTFWAIKNIPYYVNVMSVTTNDMTVNITAESNIRNDILKGKLLFILPNNDEINANYNSDGTWWAVYTFDDYMEYKVNASYTGLDGVVINNATVTISKLNSTLTVDDVVLIYGESKNVTVTTEGVTAVTAKIDGSDVDVIGNYTIPISGLGAGNYTLTVTTIPDEYHNPATVTATITVNRVSTKITVIDELIELYAKDTFSDFAALTPGDAGSLNYTLSKENVVKIEDGKIIAVGSGKVKITVSFAGNDNYTAAENKSFYVIVKPLESGIIVDKTEFELIIGDEADIIANADPEDLVIDYATDDINIVYVDENGHIKALGNGTALIFVSVGDNYYYDFNCVYVFVTVKKTTEINVNVSSGENDVTITATVDSSATGLVKFNISGETVYVDVNNGKAVYNLVLPAGEYNVEATYMGDNNFSLNSTSKSFTVADRIKKNTTITSNIAIDENNITIIATVDSNATGLVKFEVTGTEQYTLYAEIENGKAMLEDVLTTGNYEVTITYLGNDEYNSNATSETFTIVGHIKKDTTIVAVPNVDDYTVTITATVNDNATGDVTIAILGQRFIVPVENGKAIFTYDFTPGTYSADIAYLGDDDFNNATTTVSFTVTEHVVELKNTTIGVDVSTDENDVVITANVDASATGLIEINIDGKSGYLAVNNGKVEYSTILPAGNYTVVATYLGDSKFNANKTSKAFIVIGHIKKNTTITSDVVVDVNNVTISVDVDKDASGFVEFILNENSLFSKVVDGKSIINVMLPVGNYTVTAIYLGDENFNINTTDMEFAVEEVPLKNTPIDVDIVIDENNITITAIVDDNASGLVKFEVSGAEEYTLYAEIENGRAILEDVLTVGDYEVKVTYLGDESFYSNTTSETFSIVGHVKKDTAIVAVPTVEDYTVTIVTSVDSDATGYVAIAILGQTFVVPVNDGKAVFSYDFISGTYSAIVTYSGDDDFNNATTTVSFTVTEHVVELKNTTIDVDVSSDENDVTITANVDESATGLVEFNVDGKSVYIAVNNGKAVYNIDLPAGDYNVVATYLGDSKFNSNKTSKEFTVTGHIKKNTSIASDVAVDGNNVTVRVNVDGDATGFVKFALNGNEYFIEVVGGEAVIDLMLPVGNYTIAATYLGDDDFNANSTNIGVIVEEIPLKNTPIDVDIVIDENNITITAIVDDNASGLVKFEVSGAEKYTLYAEIENGRAILEDVLTVGDYEVKATYLGDENFNSNTTSETFTIVGHVKKDTAIVAVPNVEDYTVTIVTSVDSDATGYVAIAILGQTFIVPVENGQAVFAYDFNPGTYSASVTYSGDDDFNNETTTVSFTVTEHVVELKNTTISVDVSSNENDVTIAANVDESATGLVEFNVDGKSVYIAVNNGEAVYNTNLPAGDYNVVATYLGDSKFNANKTSKVFTVSDHVKNNTTITSDVAVDENNVTIAVDVDMDATGFVEFILNGNSLFSKIVDGKAVVNVMLPVGNYAVVATYLGDDDFNTNTTDIEIVIEEIPLKDTPIDVYIVIDENNITITAIVDDNASGLVKFEVSGAEEYTLYAEIENGRAILEDVLTAGDYEVKATYLGDENFYTNTTSETFTIVGHVKKDTSIVAVPNVDGYTVSIVTSVDSDATGYVAIAILGQTFVVPVNDGKAVFSYDFISGTYSAIVTYSGDDNFNNASTTTSFTVTEHVVELKNTTISVDVSTDENDVTITANVDASATGLIEININGKSGYLAINNGKVEYSTILPAGNYTVVATYLGDSRFNANKTSKVFAVTDHVKKNTTITSDVAVDGNNVTVTVNVDEDATGFVKFALNGNEYFTEIASGKAVMNLIIPVGNYTVTAIYLGDDDFNANSTNIGVIVEEIPLKNTPIDVYIVIDENNITIAAIVDSNASGLVKFDVTGTEEYILYAEIENGRAILEDVLTVGDYEVKATYLGDENFNSNTTSETFIIVGHIKKDTSIVAVPNVDGYTVSIVTTVDSDATGYVAIAILGQTFIVPVENGKSVFAYDFNPGTYSATVTYSGDDDFNNASTIVSFTVMKYVVELKNTTIDVDVITDENDVTIAANVDQSATGLVEFNVDGETVYIAVNNGKAVYNTNLPAGDYNVVATYLGDSKFNTNKTSKVFKVTDYIKKNTSITSDVVVDENNVTITVDVDKDATGFVEFILNDNSLFSKIVDGKAVVNVMLPTGNYVVAAIYLGDENFNTNTTDMEVTVEEVPLKDTPIDVYIVIDENNITITAVVDNNASGLVKFEVSGAEEYTLYAEIENGRAILEDVLTVGDYDVKATYLGDKRFNSNTTSETFTIVGHIKNDTSIVAVPNVDGYTVSIVTTVDSDATGYVAIAVLGQTFIVPINDGKAVFAYDFNPGTYSATVTYSGDDDFNNASTAVSFTVTEHAVELKNTTISVDVSSDENDVTITANVDASATGLVEFNIDGKAVYIAVNNGKVEYSTILPAGNYTVVATYLGDSKFNANKTSKAFNVADHVKKNTTIAPDVAVDENNVTIAVNVDDNVTGYVEIVISGIKYYVPVVDGVAVFKNSYVPGNYVADVNYLGDDDFNPAQTNVGFDVVENSTQASIDVNSAVNTGTVTVEVTLPEDATGYVLVDAGGQGYYAPVKDGKAFIDIIGLDEGNYTAVVTYPGDDKYEGTNKSCSITVPKEEIPENETIDPKADINISEDAVIVSLPEDATGYVLVDVDGKGYYALVKDGKAVVELPKLSEGNHTVTVTYTGDKKYSSANATQTIAVEADIHTVVADNLTKVEKAPDRFVANFTDADGNPLANSDVIFEVNGGTYTRTTDANGQASIAINLNAGNYTMLTTNPVTGEVSVNTITVLSRFVENYDLTKYFRNDSQYVVKVLGDDGQVAPEGEVVTFNINGVFYNRTVNASGYVKLNINLNPGDYIITAEYKGCRVSNNIKVLPILTGNDITKQYGVAGAYEAKLVDGQGKPYANQKIEFNINGVFYYRMTNSSGIAKLNINLQPGFYIITSSYDYARISNTVTVTA